MSERKTKAGKQPFITINKWNEMDVLAYEILSSPWLSWMKTERMWQLGKWFFHRKARKKHARYMRNLAARNIAVKEYRKHVKQ